MTPDQRHQLLRAADTAHDRALLALMVGAGLRAAEAGELRRRDVNLLLGCIKIRGQWVDFGAETARHLRAHLADLPQRGDVHLFTSRSGPLTRWKAWQIVSRTALRAGLDASPRALRNLCAQRLLEAGASPRLVARHLRRKTTAHLSRYTQP